MATTPNRAATRDSLNLRIKPELRGLIDRAVQLADARCSATALVHAISEEAKAFYVALGLSESPLEPMTLMVTLANLRATL
jgi:uncharacterized protein (DUF1778 family)